MGRPREAYGRVTGVMMYWEEASAQKDTVSDNTVDLVFDITCRTLPVDHAYPLLQALLKVLPWLTDESGAGVHPIHGAESGNGWIRPESPRELLYLSRRTKLILRLPAARIDDARALTGRKLALADHTIEVGKNMVRRLHPITTVFSRYVVAATDTDEPGFLVDCVDQLREIGVVPKKMLCGRETCIALPNGSLRTRSLMLAELSFPESIALQLRGLGSSRALGCGLFVGHRDIKPVKQETD